MTLSLSLLCVHWILCYKIKNISFMVFIKQLKPRIFVECNCCYTDWSLAFQGEGCGFESWDWKSFSSFLFLHLFPSFSLHCVSTQLYAHLWTWSTITSTINILVVVYLAYGSTANFRFRGPIAKINITKEPLRRSFWSKNLRN